MQSLIIKGGWFAKYDFRILKILKDIIKNNFHRDFCHFFVSDYWVHRNVLWESIVWVNLNTMHEFNYVYLHHNTWLFMYVSTHGHCRSLYYVNEHIHLMYEEEIVFMCLPTGHTYFHITISTDFYNSSYQKKHVQWTLIFNIRINFAVARLLNVQDE